MRGKVRRVDDKLWDCVDRIHAEREEYEGDRVSKRRVTRDIAEVMMREGLDSWKPLKEKLDRELKEKKMRGWKFRI